MAEDLSGWTLQKAPSETEGWTLHPVAATPAIPQRAAPGKVEAALLGAGQGFTLGFGDEINAFAQAVDDKLIHGDEGSFADRYKYNRAGFRKENAEAKAEHPWLYGGSEVAASIPATFIPGVGISKGAKLGETLLKATGAGALSGLGLSDAKTAAGNAWDALVGGAVGLGAGAVGRKLGGFSGKAADEVRLANADQAQKVFNAAKKAEASARGAYGGDVASVLDAARTYEHALVSPLASAEERAIAQAKLADQEFIALYKNAFANKAAITTEKMGGRMLNSKAASEAASAATAPEAVVSAAEEGMKNPIRNQLMPRLKTWGTRAIPLAVGASMGGWPGAVAGGVTGAVMGAPGTAFANMVKHPATRGAMWSLLGGGAKPLAEMTPRAAGGASLELTPEIAAWIAALRTPPEEKWTLGAAQ